MSNNPYQVAARKAGWNLKPDERGGCFERSASDEPECVWLCGDWKELCKFADIKLEPCICCANGNDLPEGEYCRACGRTR